MDMVRAVLEQGRLALNEFESKELLRSRGLPVVAGELVRDRDRVGEALRRVGLPVAMKTVDSSLAHKSEKGLVRLNVRSEQDAVRTWEELALAVTGPDGGVLIESMASGSRELMMGLSRDEKFGPCVAFGLGGVLTELHRDIVFRMAPLRREIALDMLEGIRGADILAPFRGWPEANRERLADMLVRLGRIGEEEPRIASIDLNPVILQGGEPVVADALILLE